jgi:divalent metal cation (Fe/Co/Zn/Cd) transporter
VVQDGAALAGVTVAAVCTMLVDFTGMLVWDGVGSVLVGLILGGVATYLIQRNRSFLIGRSMKPEDFKKIVRHLMQDPVVKNIYEAKSEEIGEGIFRCVALAMSQRSRDGRSAYVAWHPLFI